MLFASEKIPCISLSCTLVPAQYRKYEYGLLHAYLIYSRGRTLMRKFFYQLKDEET